MHSKVLVALVTLVVAIGAVTVLASAPTAIAFTMKTVERRDPQCPAKADRFACSHITFTYPVITRAPRPEAAAALTRAISDFLLASVGEPRKSESLEAAMDAFMQGYREDKALNGTTSAYWVERTVTVRYLSDTIVSLNFDLSFFLGGLHPQYAGTFASFNAASGVRIRLADVLVAGYEPRLTQIAEKAFRESHGIAPEVSLRDAGYPFFQNNTFALNDNFWIGSGGITFYYNPYEIASYAKGPTELPLPYRVIRDLITPEGLLGPMR